MAVQEDHIELGRLVPNGDLLVTAGKLSGHASMHAICFGCLQRTTHVSKTGLEIPLDSWGG
jgi:hypothetical protein